MKFEFDERELAMLQHVIKRGFRGLDTERRKLLDSIDDKVYEALGFRDNVLEEIEEQEYQEYIKAHKEEFEE